MKFYYKSHGWGNSSYDGRKGGFKFSIAKNHSGLFYFCSDWTKGDIRYNSLWDAKEFKSLEDAQKYCEKWIPKGHTCLGDNVKDYK